MKFHASIAIAALGIGTATAAVDLWDLQPLRYSETAATDRIAKLSASLADGELTVEGDTPLEKLRFILKLLEIPEESQILVFSKTSKQNALISSRQSALFVFQRELLRRLRPGR